MLGLPLHQQLVLALQTLVLLGLVLRLFRNGLSRTYPVFFSFLIAEAAQSLSTFVIHYGSALYTYLFLLSQTVLTCFFALIVLELYSIVLGGLTGIASIVRTYTMIAIGLAILLSTLLLSLEQNPSDITGGFLIFERSIVSSLVFFVLLFTVFLLYYPVPLNRNVLVYFGGYAFYFLVISAGLFARNVRVANLTVINSILVTVSTTCFLFWLIFLNREGEKKSIVLGHRWNRQDEIRLLQQLQAINESLLRSVRK